ncbi:hypothetical protein D3C71_1964300 [compost metagenome]
MDGRNLLLQQLVGSEQLPHMLEYLFTVHRQPDSGPVADQQLQPELMLQTGDGMADSGLGEAQSVGGFRKAAQFNNLL